MRKFIFSVLIFVITFFVVTVGSISAKTLSSNTNVSIAKNEVLNDDLFVGAQNVTIEGTVNGDVFIGAQSITVNGIINGNLHAAGNMVSLSGSVKGNAYIVSANISVNTATIGGSLLLAGSNVNIDKNSSIGGSILTGAGNVAIDSQVKRSVYIGAGTATIASNAKIGKDLYYSVGENMADVNIQSGAVISGGIYKSQIRNIQPVVTPNQIMGVARAFRPLAFLFSLLGSLVIGIFYLRFLRNHFLGSSGYLSKSFWKSLGIGFLIMVAALPAFIILLVTVVGIPLAGVAFLLLMLGISLAKVVASMALGGWIATRLKWNKLTSFVTFALGLLVISILNLIPVVTAITSLVVLWAGLGAITAYTLSTKK